MNQKGFTLIELLVVINIITILTSVVIVALNPARQFAAARCASQGLKDNDACIKREMKSPSSGKAHTGGTRW